MHYDFDEPKVKIPIKVKRQHITFPDGSTIPQFYSESLGDLSLPISSIKEVNIVPLLTSTKDISILNAYCQLFAVLNTVTDVLSSQNSEYQAALSRGYGKIIILESLKIRFKGFNVGKLLDCKCTIPALDREAKSINHAFTLLSEEFEKNRLSHTGNVFKNVFYSSSEDNQLKPLGKLRHQNILIIQEELISQIRIEMEKRNLLIN